MNIDWNDENVKSAVTACKAFLTGLDGEGGAIGEVTANVLPDFGDDYVLIAEDWNAYCPCADADMSEKRFHEKLLNGDADALAMLEARAKDMYVGVMEFAERAREKIARLKAESNGKPLTFKWVMDCECNHAESKRTFATLKECYEDMRNAALEKAKWNTEFDEDFDEGVAIDYAFTFHPLKVVHKSYSGTYTYVVKYADGTDLEEGALDKYRE